MEQKLYFKRKVISCILSFLILALLPLGLKAEPDTLIITNQTEFDGLRNEIIRRLVFAPDTLRVVFDPGIYYYDENNNLSWGDKRWDNSVLEITGNPDAVFIARTTTNTNSVSWENGSIYFERQGTRSMPVHYERWTEFEEVSDTCSYAGIDQETGFNTCEIGGGQLMCQYPNAASIQFTEWYTTHIYEIKEITNYGLTFNLNDSSYFVDFPWGDGIKRVLYPNFDYYNSWGRKMPRYRLISNPQRTENGKQLYYCTAGSFANFWNTNFRAFTVRGMRFMCNKKVDYRELFRLCDDTATDGIVFEDCTFSDIRGQVLYFERTDNVIVRNNTFQDCYENCVVSTNGSNATQVIGNTFDGIGKGMDQNFGVICRGNDFLIQGNTFTRFSYAAIGVGCDLDNPHSEPITGIVEGNLIDNEAYTSEDSILEHTLMDAGAIYTWAWNDDVVIRNNTIRNYGGVHQYRGIFCDQGTMNVTLTGNTISNIQKNAWGEPQYDIEISWREDAHAKNPDHNTGNFCFQNYLDPESAGIHFDIEYDCHCDMINVDSQAAFDTLGTTIAQCIANSAGKNNILINLQPNATFYFHENHIDLSNIHCPIAININGNNAKLIPQTRRLTLNDISVSASSTTRPWLRQRYNGRGEMEETDGWSEWNYAMSDVYRRYNTTSSQSSVFSISNGLTTFSRPEIECRGLYIHLTE